MTAADAERIIDIVSEALDNEGFRADAETLLVVLLFGTRLLSQTHALTFDELILRLRTQWDVPKSQLH